MFCLDIFWPTCWILLKQLFLSPSWAIDSEPIRAWGIIVNNTLKQCFTEDVNTTRQIFPSHSNLGSVSKNSIPKKFTCIWHFKQVKIIATKSEKSKVLIIVAFLLLSPSSIVNLLINELHVTYYLRRKGECWFHTKLLNWVFLFPLVF